MKVLVVGSGGREHVLLWALSRSPRVDELLVAPGNAGMEGLAHRLESGLEVAALLELARRERPDLTVVGPEAPLVAGVADAFAREGLRLVGPTAAAARLEGSKRYAKAFMARHGVPTAAYAAFDEVGPALAELDRVGAPVVVKDSELAAGKGVTVARSLDEARAAVTTLFDRPGAEVVIEECLVGEEASLLLFTDGDSAVTMPLAQDHKQADDGDRGPMTGGMGAVAPVAGLGDLGPDTLFDQVAAPTLAGLRAEGFDYRGVLYIGLMLTAAGPRVIEYNVRFGDPEAQVLLPLLETDLLDVLDAVADRRLAGLDVRWRHAAAACVVMAAPGYPGSYRSGVPLDLSRVDDQHVVVFHAGTDRRGGRLVSSGGRVLGVTGLGDSVDLAIERAYRAVAAIGFEGAHYRNDIGRRSRPERATLEGTEDEG